MNGDQSADLVCVQPNGGVDIYQAQSSVTGISFAPAPYEDNLFGFCSVNQGEKAKVLIAIICQLVYIDIMNIPNF